MIRRSWMARVLVIVVAGASLAGCVAYPGGYGGGPGWGGRGYGGGYGHYGRGYGDGYGGRGYGGGGYHGGWGRG